MCLMKKTLQFAYYDYVMFRISNMFISDPSIRLNLLARIIMNYGV